MPLHGQRSSEHMVAVGDIELCVSTFGDRRQPAAVLPSTSGLFWEDEFCGRLAAADRYVVRYDIRDTGRSTAYPTGSPGYTLRDLASDLVGLMDLFGLPRAHLVGFSVAGWICQLAALDHRDRVSALTLINTRPTSPGPADPDLPDHSDRIMGFFAATPPPDWSDQAAVIDYRVEQARILSGANGFDEQHARQQARRTVDRTTDMGSSALNLAFVDAGGRSARGRCGARRSAALSRRGWTSGSVAAPARHGGRSVACRARARSRLDAARVAAMPAGIQGGDGIPPATGDIGYLESAPDTGIDPLRTAVETH
ncbi:alpha/beta fold hydrolase [Nocardia nova]|nr:alpha/beta hydrolase [Nocardia nova]